MARCFWKFGAVLLILGSGLGGAAGLAKPPDLPIELGVEFEDTAAPGAITLGFDLFTGKMSLNISLPWHLVQNWLPEMLASPLQPGHGRLNAMAPPRTAAVPVEHEGDTPQE